MKLTYKIIGGAAIALSLAVAATVSAQPGGGYGMGPGWGMGAGMGAGMGPGWGMGAGMGPGWGMGSGMGPGMGPGRGMRGFAGGDVSAYTSQLKAELKITAAQETAWKAYESALQQQAGTMQAMRTQMQVLMQNAQPGSAEFIAQRDAMLKQHDAAFQARTAALKDLYAALTPEQRAIADRYSRPWGGRGMGWMHPGA